MPRLESAPAERLRDLADGLRPGSGGFVPNSRLTMAWRPEIFRAFRALSDAVYGPTSTIEPALRNLVAQMASRAAGCGYCMAHTADGSERSGVSEAKEEALWEFETSPLYSPSERAALRVARGAAQVPNAVTDAEFADLRRFYTPEQVVDIVAVIGLFGFLNRWNDTLATELEASPIEAGKRFLAGRGWAVGKHGPGAE